MYSYATAADYTAAVPDGPVPSALDRRLRAASAIMRAATRSAIYATDAQGFPRDSRLLAAFKQAVIEQVLAWGAMGVDPDQGEGGITGAVSSVSSGGQSVHYGENKAALSAKVSSLTVPVPAAHAILLAAGLLSGRPQVV